MTTLRYDVRSQMFSAAGRGTVHEGERQVATIEARAGGFTRGPSWTWVGAFGPEWTLTASRGDRSYELRLADGVLVGSLTRSFLGSGMTVELPDGQTLELESRAAFAREQTVTWAGGTAEVVRETATFRLGSSERWTLRFEEDAVTGAVRTLLLALPLALDHRRRRQRSGGGGAHGVTGAS